MKNPGTPFPTIGYYGPEYFCDRKEETRTILNNIKTGRSTIIVAIRRMGKTGLIRHVLQKLPSGTTGIYADILPTESIKDFLNSLVTAIITAIPEKTPLGKKIWTYIKSLRPVIQFDPLTGSPQVSFDFQVKETERQIGGIFKFLEEQEKKVVIAIDEFQQILNYPEKNTEAWLRSIMQQLTNVVFIFSGSHRHLITEMFESPSKPFFRSAHLLKLGKISFPEYKKFIADKFSENHFDISGETINEMLDWTRGHTYYVQLLSGKVFLNAERDITSENWRIEAYRLLKEQEVIFFNYREILTKQQWKLLKAIAHEGITYFITSKDFVKKFDLGSPSTVLRSADSLLKKDLIYTDYDEKGKLFYHVYDILFLRWIQQLA